MVIAIIAILAGLLLPALVKAKGKAKEINCLSNMKQVGLGFMLYSENHNGNLPMNSHDNFNPDFNWGDSISKYVGEVHSIRLCSADPRKHQKEKIKGTSYIMNDHLTVPLYNAFGKIIESPPRLDQLKAPAKTVTLFEASDRLPVDAFSVDCVACSRTWHIGGWRKVIDDIQPDRHNLGFAAEDRSVGKANYLFADGHAKSVNARIIKSMINAGINPAQPSNFNPKNN